MIRIVLADDQALFREALRTLISLQPDLEVVGEAANGEEALKLAQKLRPDVILMDLQMPVMDGVEATRQIRQRNMLPRTPIFAISAFATHDVKKDALAAGCAEVFDKPIDHESLLGKIRSTLGLRDRHFAHQTAGNA
jgi:DNA-binding NarL/FixJ family response regulator